MATRLLAHSWCRLQFRISSAGFLWKLCPGALISVLVWQLITVCTRFQTCNKHPLKTHIIGIIAHEDLRKTSRSPCREAPAQHKQQPLQNQPFPDYTLYSRSTRSRHTSLASQRTTTSHSACRRSISQAPAGARDAPPAPSPVSSFTSG